MEREDSKPATTNMAMSVTDGDFHGQAAWDSVANLTSLCRERESTKRWTLVVSAIGMVAFVVALVMMPTEHRATLAEAGASVLGLGGVRAAWRKLRAPRP